jgi:hypothetical protein
MFTDTVMFGFSLKLKTCNAAADLQILTILSVYVPEPTRQKTTEHIHHFKVNGLLAVF